MQSYRAPRAARACGPAERGSRRPLAALAAAAALLGAGAARAECPGDPPALSSVPVEARIEFLREHLDAARGPGRRWSLSWAITDGALAAGQLAAIPFTPDVPGRIVLASGAAASSLVFAQMALFPVTIPPLPSPDPAGDRCADVARLERILERGARNQAVGSGAGAHAGNVVINAALGIGTGVAARRWWSGALAFGIGLALGEAQILTQPTGLVRARERYRAGELGEAPPSPPRAEVRPGHGAIVSIAVRF